MDIILYSIKDSSATNNLIKIILFFCIFSLAFSLSNHSISLLNRDDIDKDRRQLANNILTMVATGILSLGAGAGLR